MKDNFDIFAGIVQDDKSKKPSAAQEEDFFNMLANNNPAPALNNMQNSQKPQQQRPKAGPLFQEDDVLDHFEGKNPVSNALFEEQKFAPQPSQQELIFGKSTNQLGSVNFL